MRERERERRRQEAVKYAGETSTCCIQMIISNDDTVFLRSSWGFLDYLDNNTSASSSIKSLDRKEKKEGGRYSVYLLY